MWYEKYKDAEPEQTIRRIVDIYENKLNLKMKLKVSKRLDNIYSATLSDVNAKWNVSGKGTSELYCSASAYGESIEHLCNYFAYDISELSAEAKKAWGFEKYPDEVLLDWDEIKKELPDMMNDLQASYRLAVEKAATSEELIDLWKQFLKREKLPCTPYYSVQMRKYKYIPEDVIFYLCGSNGGGAGNTPEEAIGHACDEILERYVKYNIYMKELTPPEVPKEYIDERCPELIQVIKKIEENEGYKIIVKDASMGSGYSVLSVLMVNQNHSEYLVNFGAHPMFEIALERCLTEMFQAFVPEKSCDGKKMEKWSEEFQNRAKFPQNWVTILKDDSGVVPDSYFGNVSSWDFKPWPKYEKYSNRLGLQIQIRQLLSVAPDVYIHDVSFLGFPSYRVYVPIISTSHIPFDKFQLECYRSMEKYSGKLHKKIFTLEEIAEIENTLFHEKTFVNGLIFRSLSESRFHFLHAAVCYDLNNLEDAKKYLRLSRSEYSECLIREIELEQKRKEKKEIDGLISLFFIKEYSDLARGWRENGAFYETLSLYEADGISLSPRVLMNEKRKDAINSLHVALKKVMYENKNRGEALDKIFADMEI